jgi:hypothetical protein
MSQRNHRLRERLTRDALGLGGSLIIPATAVTQRYLGLKGTVIYVLTAALILAALLRAKAVAHKALRSCGPRRISLLLASTFILVAAVFAVLYPIADAGVVGGGSDADDALNVAVHELLRGRYPYSAKTYLGNPLSPMPGAVLLAAPFVLLGTSAYQNLFWLLVFYVILAEVLYDRRRALLLLWAMLLLSPGLLHNITVGSDYVANTIYVLSAILWLASPEIPYQKVAAVFLGIGLSSRANFLLLLPAVGVYLSRVYGPRTARDRLLLSAGAFALVTLPFVIYDPGAFSPFHTYHEVAWLDRVVPFAGILIPGITGLLSVVLAFLQDDSRLALMRSCCLVMATPVLLSMVLASVYVQAINFQFAAFGSFFLFFGVVGFSGVLVAGEDIGSGQ